MTFLNATLLTGLVAVVVPIVMHLIARRQPQQVTFPAVRFLQQRVEANRTRLNVMRWWLLVMRILLVAALAFALARPMISSSVSTLWLSIGVVAVAGIVAMGLAVIAATGNRSRSLVFGLFGVGLVAIFASVLGALVSFARSAPLVPDNNGPIAVCLVIDNPPVIEWNSTSDDRIAATRASANAIIDRLSPGSRIAAIDRSAVPAFFSIDAAAARAKIAGFGPQAAPVPMETTLSDAVELLRTSELESKQIVLVSGLTRTTWDPLIQSTSISRQIAEGSPVSITVIDSGPFEGVNRSLGRLQFDRNPTPDTSTTLACEVSVASQPMPSPTSPPTSVTAELVLYGDDSTLPVVRNGRIVRPQTQTVDRQNVTLPAGSAVGIDLTLPPLPAGIRHGFVRLVGRDALWTDDRRYFTVNVAPPPNILIVTQESPTTGNRPSTSLGDAVVMRKIIEAFFKIPVDPAKPYIVDIASRDLSTVRLDEFRCIILLDPDKATLLEDALANFLTGGGTGLLLLGPSAGKASIPATLVGDLRRPWRAPSPGTFFAVTSPNHPVFNILRIGGDRFRWSDFRIQRYWQVEPTASAIVLATYAGTEHPAILSQSFGAGELLTVTTPMPALDNRTRRWNDLFAAADAWPAFSLITQMLEFLARRDEPSTAAVIGQPFLVSRDLVRRPEVNSGTVDDRKGSKKDNPNVERWQFFAPDDSPPVPIDVRGGDANIPVASVSKPGNYFLRYNRKVTGFSANLSDALTDPRRIIADDLERVFGSGSCALVSDTAEVQLSSSGEGSVVGLRSPILLLVAVLFMLEQLLSNRFYGPRPNPPGTSRT